MTLRKKISWVLISAALATGSAGAQDADQMRQMLMGKGASLTPTVTGLSPGEVFLGDNAYYMMMNQCQS